MKRGRFIWSVSVLVAAVLLAASCRTVGFAGSPGEGEMSSKRIVVSAGNHERRVCPVEVAVDESLARLGQVSLVDDETGMTIPAQIAEQGGKHVLSFVVPFVGSGRSKSYRVVEKATEAKPVTLKRTRDGEIDVSVGGEPVTAYHFASDYKKPFMYPVLGSDAARMTRGWPMEKIEGEERDHVHQKSFWVAHGKVNGVDFWGEGRGSGTQRTDAIVKVESGGVRGLIHARNSWIDKDGNKIVSEERQYVFYLTPPELRIIDLTVTFTAPEGDVTFGDTKEGGIAAIRVNPVINANRHGEIRNSLGAVGEGEAWGKRASWCDYSGPIDGKTRGIAVLDSPGNPRYPACWHVRGYGLMGANYFGYTDFKSTYEKQGDLVLPGGESMTFRYRILIHDGNGVEANIADRYVDYIAPPRVKVSS
jgi:hypothetical protein